MKALGDCRLTEDQQRTMAQKTLAINMLYLGWVGELSYAIVQAKAVDLSTLFSAVRIFMLVWWAGAGAFFFGAISGILFGIPKVIEDKAITLVSPPSRRYKSNANIEEISDWLTKIIVGLTLVNLRQIQSFLSLVGSQVSAAIFSDRAASAGELQGGKIVAISAIVYGFSCGFLHFYFWARDAEFDYEKRARLPDEAVTPTATTESVQE